jgi:hypothetical protein
MKCKRQIVIFAVVLSVMLGGFGCAKKTGTTPTPTVQGCKLLADGTCDQLDVSSYRILVDARTFLKDIGDSVRAGKLTLTAQQKLAYNALVVTSNTADAQWEIYHAGGNNATQLQTATAQLNTSMANASGLIKVGQ